MLVLALYFAFLICPFPSSAQSRETHGLYALICLVSCRKITISRKEGCAECVAVSDQPGPSSLKAETV